MILKVDIQVSVAYCLWAIAVINLDVKHREAETAHAVSVFL